MSDQRPIPRAEITDALHFVEAIQRELEGRLSAKGFVSGFYLHEKSETLTRRINFITGEHFTGAVAPPKEAKSAT